MKRYMLDTNIVSRFVRGHPGVDERVTALPMASLCISAITEGELRYGLARRPQSTRLHATVLELLRGLDVLPWDSRVAQRYGAVRADLESRGRPLAGLDLLIAAHALQSGAILVTDDKAFRQIEELPVEDWT